eukprot:14757716-Ditylum_brightwellii.AAC.1
MNNRSTVDMAICAERLTVHWAKSHSPHLLFVLDKANNIIPSELRYDNTFWTGFTLVGDLQD